MLPPSRPAESSRVIVFHCSKKISSIKRKRYVDATERGMGMPPMGTRRSAKATSPSPSPVVSMDKAIDEGKALAMPPKKRLKLTVREPAVPRPPSNESDTIAVSRPKRKSVAPGRYSEVGPMSDDDADFVVSQKKKTASPAESSDLSSLDSRSVSMTTDVTPDAPSSKENTREDYGDFMSYYVLDDEEDQAKVEGGRQDAEAPLEVKSKTEKKAKASKDIQSPSSASAQQQSKLSQQQHTSVQQAKYPQSQPSKPLQKTKSRQKSHAHAQAGHQAHPPGGHYHHMPAHASIHVSPQLAQPPIPMPSPPVMETLTVKYQAGVKEMAKNLKDLSEALTPFGNSPPKTAEPAAAIAAPADNLLAMLDDDDSDIHDIDEEEKMEEKEQADALLPRPGEHDRPLTHGIEFIMNALKSWAQNRLWLTYCQAIHQGVMAVPSQPIVYNLSNTPEMVAIRALRKVVESGCIQVNAVLPQDLSDAVCRLYMQIDGLINQGGNEAPRHIPMSYSAQIHAHEERMRRHRYHQAAMQAQRLLEQQAAHQQAMQQIGLPAMQAGMAGHVHAAQNTASASQRRRKSSQMQQQQYIPRVMLASTGPGMPISQISGHRPSSASAVMLSGPLNGLSTGARLPFSGQSLQFSFDHPNPAAYEAFGQGAFPAPQQHVQLPNRGPMPVPIGQAASGARRHSMSGQRGPSRGSDSHAHPLNKSRPADSFTPVNEPVAKVPSGASDAVSAMELRKRKRALKADGIASSSTPLAAKRKSTTGVRSMANNFPHPGAVIIDD